MASPQAACAGEPATNHAHSIRTIGLRTRATEEVDLADIGALAVPTPSLADLNATIQAHYGFLRQLDPDERQLAETREQERHLALRLLNELPGAHLASLGLY